MPDHELEFHGNHLAVNVKVYLPYWPDLADWSKRIGVSFEELADEIWNQFTEMFWMQSAPDIARDYGFDGVESEGRSNGWCVPIYGGKPVERAYLENILDEECTGIIKNYFLFRFKIKRIVKGVNAQFREAMIEELRSREIDFLYDRSIGARVIQHVVIEAYA